MAKTNVVDDEFIDMNGAISFTKISRSGIYRLIRDKRINYYQPTGGKLLFKKSELRKLIEGSKVA